MRSLIIIEVEHGEDTDAFADLIDSIERAVKDSSATLNDYTVRIDLPACFVLDPEPETNDGITCDDCGGNNGSHFLNCIYI